MKRMWGKVIFVGVICFMLIIASLGCSTDSGGENQSGDKAEQPTIGFVTINQEALFFTQMIQGAQEEAENLGVNLVVINPNNDPIEQSNGVENLVEQGVDAIIINAIDVNGIIPAMEKASTAGIPVISVDSIVESDAVDVQIGVDNRKASEQLGEFFNEYAEQTWDGDIEIGVVGALNSFIQVMRQDGFIDTVEQLPNTKIVDIVDGQNVQERALSAAENLLIGNPNLRAVFATGEPAFIGAAAAAQSQGNKGEIKFFGWDLSPQIIQGIDEGWIIGVIQQHPDNYGKESVRSAVNLIKGEEVPKNIDVPATIVTQENVADFKSLFE